MNALINNAAPAKSTAVSRGTKQIGQRLLPWIVPILLIVIWQIASKTGLLESRVLPAPTAVVSAFWTLLVSGELWQHSSSCFSELISPTAPLKRTLI